MHAEHATAVSIPVDAGERSTAGDTGATPSSTTGVRYVPIAATSRNAGGLPMLQTRMPITHSGSSNGSSLDSSRRPHNYSDMRESSMVMSSNKTDDSMRKYLRDLMQELGVDGDASSVNAMPVPPPPVAPSEPDQLDEAPLGDPAHPAIGLFRRCHFGLLISVVFAGLLTSCLKRGVLPIMRSELQMAAYQADAAEVLVMLPWSSMFFIGFVSDCFAFCGSHRKSYVVLGWTLVVISLFVLAIVTYANSRDAATGGTHAVAFVNGAVFLLGVACFGGILTVVMAEVYFVAMSKRERLRARGEVVGTLLLVQFFFETLGQGVTNYVVFHTTPLGVQPLVTLREITVFLSLTSLVPLCATVLFFHEDAELMRAGSIRETEVERKIGMVETVRTHAKLVWTLLQRESTWSVVRFLVLFVFFSEFLVRYAHLVLDEVCGITLTVASTGKIIQELLSFGAVLVWRMFLLNADWKWCTLIGFLGVAWVPQMIYSLCVLFNVSRDVGLYMLSGATKSVVRGLIVALQVAMAVEIAPRGAEGVTVGVVMSIATVMRLLATTASSALSFAFATQTITANGLNVKLSLAEEIAVGRDPTAIKLPKSLERQVLLALLVCYTIKLLACGGVGFLPHQKQHLQWLHRFGKSSPRYAVGTILILAVSLLIAAAFNALVVTPRTSCLKAFGGKGCIKVT